jgi:hypothetical protein
VTSAVHAKLVGERLLAEVPGFRIGAEIAAGCSRPIAEAHSAGADPLVQLSFLIAFAGGVGNCEQPAFVFLTSRKGLACHRSSGRSLRSQQCSP